MRWRRRYSAAEVMAVGLRMLTAGESHGRGLVVVLEGLPSGLEVDMSRLEGELERRRRGFGRGGRMEVEKDRLTLWGGIRGGRTTGSPIGITVENSEWESWRDVMDPLEAPSPRGVFTCPRPGHADLAGGVKHGFKDLRDVLERASARQTAAWTVAGTLCRMLLEGFEVRVFGAVLSIGGKRVKAPSTEEQWLKAMASPMGCWDPEDGKALMEAVRSAMEEGVSLGGSFGVMVRGLPPGIGSYGEWDLRLDGRLCGALMAIPSVKAVEVGDGAELGDRRGPMAQDEILLGPEGVVRPTNRAGGIEGGMSNGEDVLLKAVMKPIPTMRTPLRSLDLLAKEPAMAHRERCDTCAVPAGCVVGEAMTAFVTAAAMVEQFGGGALEDLLERVRLYRERVRRYLNERFQ
ncbi:MAG: chorismate synthase [Thermanaerothrix sp.]|nr:chorismate synthase [Thermanaerothrix sp.]